MAKLFFKILKKSSLPLWKVEADVHDTGPDFPTIPRTLNLLETRNFYGAFAANGFEGVRREIYKRLIKLLLDFC